MKTLKRLAIVFIVAIAALGITIQRWPRPIPIAEADTVIIYSPHPDDETYGMGQAIAAQSLTGRRVVGVLMTDGEASGVVEKWATTVGTDLDGNGVIDKWDFGLARREEYRAAMGALGVDELVFLGAADSQGQRGFRDSELSGSETRILDVLESVVTSVSPSAPVAHITVARWGPNPLTRERLEHTDHTALSSVVEKLATGRAEELHLYKVYAFHLNRGWMRWATAIVRGSDEAIARKRAALEAYGEIGRMSTGNLWHASYASDVEYLAVIVHE